MNTDRSAPLPAEFFSFGKRGASAFLLLVAGLGGLLYGIDVGIIGGALPYLEATSGLDAAHLSRIVAAVLLGSVIATLFAGVLADWMGRKPLMILSGAAFALSIPVIALSQGYTPLLMGRLLQGVSGGFIGVVVPLYLAECLPASERGKGTGVFQWLLTLGIVAAAVAGIFYSYRVEEVARAGDAAALFAYKAQAWRRIFWLSLPPGILFALGSMAVSESPRWLYLCGKAAAARAALLRSRGERQAELEMREMELRAQEARRPSTQRLKESLLHRKYVVPFLLACTILFCNTATGVNTIIGFSTNILLQSGLSDLEAHWGYVILTAVNFLMTVAGMMLVDRKGRKFLLVLGSSGIIVSIAAVGLLFLSTEVFSFDCRDALQAQVTPNQELTLRFNAAEAERLLAWKINSMDRIDRGHASLSVIYSCGDFTAATSFVRSDDQAAAPIRISREHCLPANRVEAFSRIPLAISPLHGARRYVSTRLSSGRFHRWRMAGSSRQAFGSSWPSSQSVRASASGWRSLN